jgi:succinyl-CoA synthetase beta subunit
MPHQITGERLTGLFRPRSVALVGASDKSVFSQIAYHNLVEFGFADQTYLVSRDALTAVIARIGDLALALGEDLESLEVNPLLVDGTRIEALDAGLTWREHS